MRILIVQLSDIHCNKREPGSTAKIEGAVAALKTLGQFNGVILVCSGDLTNTAAQNEYKFGKHIMGKFLSLLGKTFDCGWIPTLIVPGNHDMVLSEQDRDIHTILKWNKEEHLQEELARMEDFFEYANSKNCFREDRICDNRILEMAGLKIQCCLLNSAPFSTRQPDDKQVHFLPERIQNQLYRAETCDLKITVMHHSYE